MDQKEAEFLRETNPCLQFQIGVMVGGDHTYVPESQNFELMLSYDATKDEIENLLLEAIGDCSLQLMERLKEKNPDVMFGNTRVRQAWAQEKEEEDGQRDGDHSAGRGRGAVGG